MLEVKNNHHNYRPDIEGLRALGIILIIGFHFFQNYFKGIFVGLDIFFVISGYLIFTVISRDLRNNNFDFFKFYLRRARRVFPALISVLLFSLIVGWIYLDPENYKDLARHVAYTSVFITNFEPFITSEYFKNGFALNPIIHMWYLSVEEQFYIICPILLWIYWKIKLGSKSEYGRKYGQDMLKMISLIIILSFACNAFFMYKHNIVAAFLLPISRFWEIGIGAFVAQIKINQADRQINLSEPFKPKISENILSIIGFATLVILSIFIESNHSFSGYLGVLPCIGTALLILSSQKSWINNYFLSNRLMVGIGIISYPLYLWHWTLLVFARVIIGHEPDLKLAISLITLSTLLAFLSYKFVEKPIREKFNSKKHLFILLGAMLIILSTSIAIVLSY